MICVDHCKYVRILAVVSIMPIWVFTRGIEMFLTEFNSTTMQRKPAEVFDAALVAPVIISRQCHESVVMLSKTEYAKLVKSAQ